MLQLQRIRTNKDQMIESLKKRGVDFTESIEQIISLDETRRSVQSQMDLNTGELNRDSKERGRLYKNGKHN